jgi:hypothetical protein
MSNFHVDSTGNLWLGDTSTTFTTSAPFYVQSDGTIKAISGNIGGISITSSSIQSSNYSDVNDTGFKITSSGDAFFNSVTVNNPVITLNSASSNNESSVSSSVLGIGGARIYENSNSLYLRGTSIVLQDSNGGSEANPSVTFSTSFDNPGFYAESDSPNTQAKLYWSSGTNNIIHSESDYDTLYIDAANIAIGTDTGGANKFIGKNSSGQLGWHTVSSASHSHTESDISDIGSHAHSSTSSWLNNDHGSHTSLGAAGGIYGSSGNASRFDHTHSGFLTSESSLSMSINNGNVSASPFITAVSGHDIVRSNQTSTNVTMRSIQPPFHSSGAYVYDLGAGPLYSYDDIWGAGSNIASDKKIKENIVDTDLGLDFINSLNPVKYKFKDVDLETVDNWDENKSPIRTRTHYGLLAQEVKEALKTAHPDNYTLDAMVVHTPNEAGEYIGEDDEFEGWALRYTELISPLVKAVQELSAKNDELQSRIEELEG